ncbi:helix-turn-helix domain-containing protein [Gordoniibacillus kamchatkensis]|uniref:helix-turn-helix domain-containing protein n=1 Tax=Gordoniibacillus kamchatkensis TaxID=1590651 RepID=UPI00069675A7|nr:helix-turn-helix transcriptional regulator [Paenibacillus sp. VKM B-2647]
MKYGNRIAQLRKQYGIPQYALAEKVNISRGSLSHYENNRRKPNYEIISRICKYFDVSIDYILGNEEQEGDFPVKRNKITVELTDKRQLQNFALTVDGIRLTRKQLSRVLAFIRVERMMNASTDVNGEYGVTS